jgi:uncharacterized membrane protein
VKSCLCSNSICLFVSWFDKTAKYIKENGEKYSMNKKGEMPWWLMMLIMSLVGLVVVLGMLAFSGGKLADFMAWLG